MSATFNGQQTSATAAINPKEITATITPNGGRSTKEPLPRQQPL